MRKFTPIPIVLMVITSIVLASGVLFPDTSTLPRHPSGSGTIRNVLESFFAADGTAQNTNMLSGVYASGYLHNMDCSGEYLNKVWVGIDADGRGICGNTAELIAILTEQSTNVTVSRDGGLTYTWVPNGSPLYEGDLIQSDISGTGMIRFVADNSLIRFAPNTDLELDTGEFDTQPVAEVILSKGRLWGRILSATGVNLGGGGMVTGVRGTSVDLQMLAGGIYRVNTVSSASTLNKMSRVVITGGTKAYFSLSAASYFGSGTIVNYVSGATMVTKDSPLMSLSSLSYGDPWVRKNTFLDIEYLSNLLVGTAVTLTPAEIALINTELDNTLVQGNRDVTTALLAEAILPSTVTPWDVAGLLDAETAGDNKNNAKALNCKMKGETYFPNMPSNTASDYCEGHWNTLWTTMDLTSTGVLDGYGSHSGVYTTSGSSTNIITASGQYLEYALDSGELATLTGKTLKIELDNHVPTPSSVPTTNKNYVLDTGTYKVYKKPDGYFWHKICDSSCGGESKLSSIPGSTTSIIIQLPPNIPTRLVIGSLLTPGFGYQQPIYTTIKRVSIQ